MKSLLLILLFSIPLNAYDDNWRYRSHAFKAKIQESHSFQISRDVLDGATRGDFIKQSNLANMIGNIAANFTPMAIYADGRDIVANVWKSAQSGFKEHKKDIALASFGAVPIVGELKKIKMAGELAKSYSTTLKASKYISAHLPPLKSTYAAEFSGKIDVRTFKKGEVIYRSPSSPYELAREPKRWFGMAELKTKRANDAFYQSNKFGNSNEIVRKYEFKHDTTVYYGQVKGGTGYQVYIPNHIDPEEVLKWKGTSTLK